MSKSIDLAKLRTINQGGATRGKSRVRRLISDESGTASGFEIDHSDGRQEAVVRPGPVRVTESLSTGEVHVG